MKSLVVVIAGIIVPLTVPTETAMAETVTTEESAVIVAMPAAEETPVAAETVTVDNTELPGADMLQNQINTMMQDTASWVDSIGSDDTGKASANGYLQLSWLPRTAEFDDIDVKFKVSLHLPQWNERLALVVGNDEEDDERLLDYESDPLNDSDDGVNVALQYIKQFNSKWQIKNRLGISRTQLYLRSDIRLNWMVKNVDLSLQPRFDYYLKDGFEPSMKAVAAYPLAQSSLSLSATWQQVQDEANSRRKMGFYHIKPIGENQLFVSGIQYSRSNDEDDIPSDSYFISVRYRNLLYKSWMFFEIEPFVEFNQANDYRDEVGIALSIFSYYGH